MLKALIFDCDGVLADTERDGHRVAFNRAFAARGLEANWDVDLYGELLVVGGGKERMRHYFDARGWPANLGDHDASIEDVHRLKTDIYMDIVRRGALPSRPGVVRLADEAFEAGAALAVCSTSNERAVNAVVENVFGPERVARFAVILAGDVVSRKKPDPEIYELAKLKLGVEGNECVVIEDNRNGLRAACGAGMHCVVTTNGYTAGEDYGEAALVVTGLGEPPDVCVSFADLARIAVGA